MYQVQVNDMGPMTPAEEELASDLIGLHDRIEHALLLAKAVDPSPASLELVAHLKLTSEKANNLCAKI